MSLSRRDLLKKSGMALAGLAGLADAQENPKNDMIAKIKDPEIRAGVDAAVNKNLLPAATERAYPGHFTISADGAAYGADTTWPGLDSWQMAGAYLMLGRIRMVRDYFDFVRASQRRDGNIPFAIFNGDTRPGDTFLRGMKYPDDLFTYKPPKREGVPASSEETRQWIGLFRHWELKSDPLSVLAPICYLLTAAEINDAEPDQAWLRERIDSILAAARYLKTRIGANGLMGGSGFYTELPPRNGNDGVTQCYAVHAFRNLAKLCRAANRKQDAAYWSSEADNLSKIFVGAFWREDHFGEYVHVERGLVDAHGLSDTNWAAVAFGLAEDGHLKKLWPRLIAERAFWLGDVPTQTVTKPFTYQEWENDPVPFGIPSLTNDVAAMGRVWFLEAMACRRMRAKDRLVESARLVSRAAKDGFWRERYHPEPDGAVKPDGGEKYCEYPAILARVVLGSPEVFASSRD